MIRAAPARLGASLLYRLWAFGFTLNTMSLMGCRSPSASHRRRLWYGRTSCATWRWARTSPGRPRRHGRDRQAVAANHLLHRGRCSCPWPSCRASPVAVGSALRPHHRLLGAGVALRLPVAGPDALGLLARTRSSRPTTGRNFIARALDRFQRLVRPPGRPLQEGHRWPSTTAGRHRLVAWRSSAPSPSR